MSTKRVEIFNDKTYSLKISKHNGWSFDGYHDNDRKVSVEVDSFVQMGDFVCLDALEELVRKMKEFDDETK